MGRSPRRGQTREVGSTKSEFSSSRIGDTFRHICNKGIIHRGLEPENVLWISNGYLKLTVGCERLRCPEVT